MRSDTYNQLKGKWFRSIFGTVWWFFINSSPLKTDRCLKTTLKWYSKHGILFSMNIAQRATPFDVRHIKNVISRCGFWIVHERTFDRVKHGF